MTAWELEYLAILASSGGAVVPSGAAFRVAFKDSTGTSTVDNIVDRITGRSWAGAPEVGVKWTRDTTEKSPNAVGLYTSTSQANVEYIDGTVGGDNLANSFGATLTQSWCFYAKPTNTDGNPHILMSMRDRVSSTALTFQSMQFRWNGTNWFMGFVGTQGTVETDLGAGGSTTPPATMVGWHHYGYSMNAGVVTLYIDGVSQTVVGSPSPFTNTITSPVLTRSLISRGATTNKWRGYMAAADGYLRALSGAEHAAWYAATVAEVG